MRFILKKTILFLFIFAFLALCILAFKNRNIFYSNNLEHFFEDYSIKYTLPKNSEIETDEIIPNNFINFGNDLAFISKSRFMVLSHDLKKMIDINHNFKFPIVKNSRFKSLIFDADGTNYIVTTKSKILKKDKTENKIITGKISERENLVFLTESDEYCCEVCVLSIDGELKYKYYFAKMYCTDVAINDEGTKIAVCGLTSEDGIIKSVIQIFDFNLEIPIFKKEFENNKFLLINFFNDSDLMAIGDNITVSINDFGSKINSIDYFNESLCLYSFDKDFGASLSFSSTNDERNQYIININKNCKRLSKIETEKKFKSIVLKDRKIFALSESFLTVFGLSGKIKDQKRVPTSCRKVLPSGHSKIYMLGNNVVTSC